MQEKNEFEKHQAAKKYHEGQDLALRGRYEEAIECYDKSISLNPEDADAYNNKGNSLSALGKYEEAIKAYNKSIELRPNDAVAINNRTIVIEKFGSAGDATRD